MPARRLVLPVLVLLTATATGLPAATGQEPEPADTNPCHDPVLALKCPDLRMAPPADLHVRKAGKALRLLATNRIVNVGAGPLELRAEHSGTPAASGSRFAQATQVVRSRTGPAVFFPLAGWVY